MLQGQAYADAGATAYDAVDGAISSVAVSGAAAVNTMVVRMSRSESRFHELHSVCLSVCLSVCHVPMTVCYIAVCCS